MEEIYDGWKRDLWWVEKFMMGGEEIYDEWRRYLWWMSDMFLMNDVYNGRMRFMMDGEIYDGCRRCLWWMIERFMIVDVIILFSNVWFVVLSDPDNSFISEFTHCYRRCVNQLTQTLTRGLLLMILSLCWEIIMIMAWGQWPTANKITLVSRDTQQQNTWDMQWQSVKVNSPIEMVNKECQKCSQFK